MTIACEFEYFKPRTLKAALTLLKEQGDGARVLAGGTDLVGLMRDDRLAPKALIDIKGIRELGGVRAAAGAIRVGALTTFNELIASSLVRRKLPLLWEAAGRVGSHGLRNRATLMGNICSAVPCCDGGLPLLLYEAEVVVRSVEGERRVPAGDWFIGVRRPDLRGAEIAVGIEFPALGKHGSCYAKLQRYKGEDLAQASVAVLVLPRRRYRVAFGAVAPCPVRSRRIEAALKGGAPTAAAIRKAKQLVPAEISPITDVRATKEYRTHMSEVMLGRALDAAAARLAGRGPALGDSVL